MKKFGNLILVFVLILGIGIFVELEVLYFQWFFPEFDQAAGGGLILYGLIMFLLVIFMQLFHLFSPERKMKEAQDSAKRELRAEEELRNVLVKDFIFLILFGLVAPLFLLASMWVL